jgi:hypothetical protein
MGSSSKESRRYDPISKSGAIDDPGAERELACRAIVATSRCGRSFARSLGKPHGSSSRASWWCSGRIDLR